MLTQRWPRLTLAAPWPDRVGMNPWRWCMMTGKKTGLRRSGLNHDYCTETIVLIRKVLALKKPTWQWATVSADLKSMIPVSFIFRFYIRLHGCWTTTTSSDLLSMRMLSVNISLKCLCRYKSKLYIKNSQELAYLLSRRSLNFKYSL